MIKTMKKLLISIIICICILVLISCEHTDITSQSANTGVSSAQSSITPLPLLSGYPQNVLPLYQPDKLMSCGFSYLATNASSTGKEIYVITYESNASVRDLFKYYGSLLTENSTTPVPSVSGSSDDQQDVDSGALDSISGKIGSNAVEINFLDNADNTATVYITYGLSSDQYTNSNPYFKGYPAGLVDEYGVQTQQETTYQEQYYGSKSIHYIKVYQTDVTQTEFSDYYQKYAIKQNYKQTSSDNSLSIAWDDQGFTCNVTYTGGFSSYITIDASKAG